MHIKHEDKMNSDSLFYWFALQSVEGIGCKGAKRLIEHFGCPERALKAGIKSWLEMDGIGPKLAENLQSSEVYRKASLELENVTKLGLKVTTYSDQNYPEKLRHCADSPLLLIYKGKLDLIGKRIISIVGTRKMTAYGASFLDKLFSELEKYDPVVISGLAYGVDIRSHELAMQHGLKTVGVLAHGMDRIYPRAHYKTALRMVKEGALLTEFWTGTAPERENFVKRNRIIAGMSEATLVIESSAKGGSLITADLANSYDREVFAVPGRSNDLFSLGCNQLIKTNSASMLTEADDLAYMLNWEPVRETSVSEKEIESLDELEKKLLEDIRSHGKIQADQLSNISGHPINEILPVLLRLELYGRIRELPGKHYEVA